MQDCTRAGRPRALLCLSGNTENYRPHRFVAGRPIGKPLAMIESNGAGETYRRVDVQANPMLREVP